MQLHSIPGHKRYKKSVCSSVNNVTVNTKITEDITTLSHFELAQHPSPINVL